MKMKNRDGIDSLLESVISNKHPSVDNVVSEKKKEETIKDDKFGKSS